MSGKRNIRFQVAFKCVQWQSPVMADCKLLRIMSSSIKSETQAPGWRAVDSFRCRGQHRTWSTGTQLLYICKVNALPRHEHDSRESDSIPCWCYRSKNVVMKLHAVSSFWWTAIFRTDPVRCIWMSAISTIERCSSRKYMNVCSNTFDQNVLWYRLLAWPGAYVAVRYIRRYTYLPKSG